MSEAKMVRKARSKWSTHVIKVTEEDIEKCVAADSYACVNATAIKRSLPNAKNVAVDLATSRFTDKATGDRYIYMTPRSAQSAIIDLDQGLRPAPYTFRLQTLVQIRPKSAIPKRTPTATIAKESEPRATPRTFTEHAPVKIGGEPIPQQRGIGFVRRFGLRSLPGKRWGRKESDPIIVKETKQ